ncbi:MAG: STAS domain-containing protein [Sterolibacteriaceae bacterium MAG5]|nr:STAS domain-containing protein [Candidatus Nitricoxidireducens bremensis]
MSFATTLQDQSAVIRMPARFDYHLSHDFRRTVGDLIGRGEGNEIVVDFTSTAYLDSAGLGLLLVLRDSARNAGKPVVLSRATGHVKKVLETAHFGKLFQFR